MQKITVKPLGDLIVMDPATKQPLPPNGAAVMKDNYWRRRIADGDVEVVVSSAKGKGEKQ